MRNCVASSGSAAYTGFDELRDLCAIAGDKPSLAIGMTGPVMNTCSPRAAARHHGSRRTHRPTRVDRRSDVDGCTLLHRRLTPSTRPPNWLKFCGGRRRVIDLADGDPNKGNSDLRSPLSACLVMRGVARWCLGIPGWRDDLGRAAVLARSADPDISTRTIVAVRSHTLRNPIRRASAG